MDIYLAGALMYVALGHTYNILNSLDPAISVHFILENCRIPLSEFQSVSGAQDTPRKSNNLQQSIQTESVRKKGK